MAKIKTLYDAILGYEKPEDKCTNFLVFILEKMPPKTLIELCKISDLSIEKVANELKIIVQTSLPKNSIPDAIIEFEDEKYLIIETKLPPNNFKKDQFLNHFNGGRIKYGKENVWTLFLSGDKDSPRELELLKKKHHGRIGFVSWKSLLQFLKESITTNGEKYEIIIEEFLNFANHYKLGRLISLNNEELKEFFEAYPSVAKYESAVEEKMTTLMDKIMDQVVLESEELVQKNKDEDSIELPCLFKAFDIKYWHRKSSAYIFINALTKNIGIVLSGYETEKEKAKFLNLWNDDYKNKFKADPNLKAFTFIYKDDEENDIYGEYFKLVKGTDGKLFDPTQLSELSEQFFWGYVYELNFENLNSYPDIISKDFIKLLNYFLKINNTSKSKKRIGLGIQKKVNKNVHD